VLLAERLVDVDQDLPLTFGEEPVGHDGGYHVAVGFTVLDEARLYIERLGGDPQSLGDLVEDLGARLAQPTLDLRQVGVGDPRRLRELPQRDLRLLALLADVLADRADLR